MPMISFDRLRSAISSRSGSKLDHFIRAHRSEFIADFGELFMSMMFSPFVRRFSCFCLVASSIQSFFVSRDILQFTAILPLLFAILVIPRFIKIPWIRPRKYLASLLLASGFVIGSIIYMNVYVNNGVISQLAPSAITLTIAGYAPLVATPWTFLNCLLIIVCAAVISFATWWVAPAYAMANYQAMGNGIIFGCCINFIVGIIYKYSFFCVQQEKTIRAEAEKIKSVFNSSHHALFQIAIQNHELIIHGEKSQASLKLIGSLAENQSFESEVLRFFQLPADQRVQIQAVLLASIGEDLVSFELNSSHLPQEIEFFKDGHERIFLVEWTPLCLESIAVVSQILISMTDVTALRAEEIRAKKAEVQNIKIVELVHIGQHRVQQSFRAIDELLAKIHDSLKVQSVLISPRQIYATILIGLHTIKGNARSLGLTGLSEVIHEIESKVVSLSSQDFQASDWHFEVLMKDFLEVFRDYKASLASLGWNQKLSLEIEIAALSTILDQRNWFDLQDLVANQHPESETFERFISPKSLRFSSILRQAFQTSLPVLKRLRKFEAILEVSGFDLWLRADAGQQLAWILPHLFANAFDHGIESPEERTTKGKPERGNVAISVSVLDGHYKISVQDDGRGLSLKQITELSLKRGIVNESRLQELSDQEKAMLIFEDGLSTKDEVSEISGRGMGMAAIREAILGLGGRVSISLSPAIGRDYLQAFSIDIYIPNSLSEVKARATAAENNS